MVRELLWIVLPPRGLHLPHTLLYPAPTICSPSVRPAIFYGDNRLGNCQSNNKMNVNVYYEVVSSEEEEEEEQ